MNEELLTTETMADYEDHFDDANPWNRVQKYLEEKTVLPVKIEGIVNGGAIAMVEGLRGFIPASKLSLSYIEDLETYLLKDIEVQVIDVDQAENRLVLSARELLKEKAKKEREEKISNIKVGAVLKGTVESLQTYGAFVSIGDGLSGLVHISQISDKRIKTPSAVLNVGDEVEDKSHRNQRRQDQSQYESADRRSTGRRRNPCRTSKIRRDWNNTWRFI